MMARREHRLKRAVVVAVGVIAACVGVVSCGGVDRQKFDKVYNAGKALQAEVQAPTPSASKARDRLKEFDTEIAAVQDHLIGIHEVDALHAYSQAADAYRYFLRFRAMDADDNGGLVLKGPNLEAATRFKLPIDTRNGAQWVNRGQAITILLQAGDQHLSDGNRLAGR